MPPIVISRFLSQPVSAMRKADLQNLCAHFDINDTSSVTALRIRLKTHLKTNQENLEDNSIYARLYPRCPRDRLNPQAPPSDQDNDQPDDIQPPNAHPSPPPSAAGDWQGIQNPIPSPIGPALVPPTPPPSTSPDPDILPSPFPEPRICRSPSFTTLAPAPVPPSPSKRPIRIPGSFAAGAGFLVPDAIHAKFRNGWTVHIPLTYLTDKHCAYKKNASVFQDSLSIDETSGRLVTASKPLSDAGELDLTFEEWHQAWRRLLPLIREFLPDDFDAWNTHFLAIRDKETLTDCWRLWLAYDTKIRRRSVHKGIDPAIHHISVWNDLEIRYIENKISNCFRNEIALLRSHPLEIIPFVPVFQTKKNPKWLEDASSAVILPALTSHAIAPLPPSSTANLAISNAPPLPNPEKTKTAVSFASPGMASLAADQAHAAHMVNTSARYAAPALTTPNTAPLSDFCPIITPLVADAWETALLASNLLSSFIDVPYGIRHSFDMGICSAPLVTYTPPNHSSALNNPNAVLSYIHTELSSRRYSGPFSRSRLELLIGSFRTSPLGTVPKPGTSDFRLIQDFSFPRNDPLLSSINSGINSDDFKCDWGTFRQVVGIVLEAPPSSLAATLDVDAAFRRCPIRPSQQSSFVIMWNNLFYIDHIAPFGASSSGGVFGCLADSLMAMLRHQNIGPALNWVDDFLFFNFPIISPPSSDYITSYPSFTYSLDTIFSFTSPLGWPWKSSKTRPFAPVFKYLGFVWDLVNKSVQIPDDKKLRYLSKLKPWIHGSKFTQRETQSLLGTLVHCSLAIPDSRSHLPAISRFAASFNMTSSPFIKKSPNSSVLSDICWWQNCLSTEFAGSILQKPPPPSPIEFWVDASTDWGVGLVFDGLWDSWKFKPGWRSNGHNIGWAEFVAIEIGLIVATSTGHSNTHFIVRSDNQGVIYAIEGRKSRSPEQNIVLQRITFLLSTYNIWISSLYVPSSTNLADPPSRGIPIANLPRKHFNIPLPSALCPFIISSPPLPTK